MPDIDDTFLNGHDGSFVVIVDADIKCSPTYGNYGCGCKNPIVIRLSAPLLDVDFHPAHQNIQQIAPVSGILAKDDIGIGINLESTTIGNLELRVAVWTGDNDLPGLHFVTDVQGPGYGIAKRRYIAV